MSCEEGNDITQCLYTNTIIVKLSKWVNKEKSDTNSNDSDYNISWLAWRLTWLQVFVEPHKNGEDPSTSHCHFRHSGNNSSWHPSLRGGRQPLCIYITSEASNCSWQFMTRTTYSETPHGTNILLCPSVEYLVCKNKSNLTVWFWFVSAVDQQLDQDLKEKFWSLGQTLGQFFFFFCLRASGRYVMFII